MNLGVDRLAGRKDCYFRRLDCKGLSKFNCILNNIALLGQRRRNVDSCVGDKEGPRISRDIHNEGMANPSPCQQALFLIYGLPQQLLNMGIADHQRFYCTRSRQSKRLLHRRMTMLRTYQLIRCYIYPRFLRKGANLMPWPNEGRDNKAGLGRFQCPA